MIRFSKYLPIYLIISTAIIVPGLFSLFQFGLRPSVDFTGGSRLRLGPKEASDSGEITRLAQKIKDYFEKQKRSYQAISADGALVTLRAEEMSEGNKNELLKDLNKNVALVGEVSFETLGPTLGKELIFKTIVGVVLALLLISFYIVYQFRDRLFGLGAILATLHDTLVILGVFSLLGKFFGVEVDTLFVTAVLTVLSFSVHDTIVVFDRIREKVRESGFAFSQISVAQTQNFIDEAVNETLVRSFNNSLTVVFVLLALVVLGGETIRIFALALLVGTVSGTYSSSFVAVPLLLVFKKLTARSGRETREK